MRAKFREIESIEIEMCNGGWPVLPKIIRRINKMSFTTDVQFYYVIYDWFQNTKELTGKMFVYIMTNVVIKYKKEDENASKM